ncbi:MAG: ankyrin repeat domain-containing protein [Oscillatoria sp. PMC 1051.18]|nr:ankyrin repeat domain-containing protein [Oscillatoria sp. PMC 1050.18]MEC5032986.1 ankyrin repeat domain-containing protein [Oscillatoria sp. PMC 1051.18]
MSLINSKNSEVNLLFKAIQDGDFIALQRLVKSNINLEQEDNRGYTPLLLAVNLGHLKIAKTLLNAGASPCWLNEMTIVNAIYEQRQDILLFLINLGIDVNQKLVENENRTVLMEAAKIGDLKIVKTLVEHGSDVNAVSKKNHFALMNAACQGWQEIYNYLAPLTSSRLRNLAEKALPNGSIARKRKDDIQW